MVHGQGSLYGQLELKEGRWELMMIQVFTMDGVHKGLQVVVTVSLLIVLFSSGRWHSAPLTMVFAVRRLAEEPNSNSSEAASIDASVCVCDPTVDDIKMGAVCSLSPNNRIEAQCASRNISEYGLSAQIAAQTLNYACVA